MARTLLPEHETQIDRLAEMGAYDDMNQVISDALFFLEQRIKVQALKEKLDIGIRQYERGETVDWTPELSSERMEIARRQLAAGEKPHPDVCP